MKGKKLLELISCERKNKKLEITDNKINIDIIDIDSYMELDDESKHGKSIRKNNYKVCGIFFRNYAERNDVYAMSEEDFNYIKEYCKDYADLETEGEF